VHHRPRPSSIEADATRVKEAASLAKSAAQGDDPDLAQWALRLLESRERWSDRQRKRRITTIFPV